MQDVLYYLIVFIIVSTLVPLIRNDYWIFRVFEYPRLQKFVLNIVLLVAVLTLSFPSTTWQYVVIIAFMLNLIHLRLVNITSNGTYSFQNADTTLEDVTRAFYSEETLSYSTDGTNADILSFGTVEISEISATHIAAKLNVMLGDTGSLSRVYLEEIFIVGDFK